MGPRTGILGGGGWHSSPPHDILYTGILSGYLRMRYYTSGLHYEGCGLERFVGMGENQPGGWVALKLEDEWYTRPFRG